MATYWENSCSFGLRYVSWYKYLIVSLVFSHLGFWSGNLFLIAPFSDLCLLVPFNNLPFRGINPQPYIPGLNTSQQRLEGNRYQGFLGYQTQYGQNKEFMANRLTNSIKSAVLDILNFQ